MEMQKMQRVQKIQIMENADGHICCALTRESGVHNFRYAENMAIQSDQLKFLKSDLTYLAGPQPYARF